jgi:hypothetical protein
LLAALTPARPIFANKPAVEHSMIAVPSSNQHFVLISASRSSQTALQLLSVVRLARQQFLPIFLDRSHACALCRMANS